MSAIKLNKERLAYKDGALVPTAPESSSEGTIAAGVLSAHNSSKTSGKLELKFDILASHDITFVGIIQTARASGMERFPVPYVLTCCHNSLCAVGGTINADDHAFGLSAAKKYGGVFVPPHIAVIHQYMREMAAGAGKMILGSDSHTRYGPFGTLGFGEGGPELAKQLLSRTYDIDSPEIVAVYLHGKPQPGVGPQDVAIAIIGAVFKNGFVKNKVMEFIGPGIKNLPMDFRIGIDVMTTETTCLSSIWETDKVVLEYLKAHGREAEYKALSPQNGASYDGAIEVDLGKIEPMIAIPFHPSNAYAIKDFIKNAQDILRTAELDAAANGMGQIDLVGKVKNGHVFADQGIIAGCAGGLFDNVMSASTLLGGKNIGSDSFSLSVYPASQPVFMELVKNGAISQLMSTGATIRSAFCGPCFGAGDVPENSGFSLRHTTRNFPSREGSKPGEGQSAAVALMDARSIAASASKGGMLTPATELSPDKLTVSYSFDKSVYENRVYKGTNNPKPETELVMGPNITDWPKTPQLTEDILLKLVSVITDPVTTTDELIPSGEASSYRSNPLRLAEFTLSRKDPEYVTRAKEVAAENAEEILKEHGLGHGEVMIKSAIYATKPGDGSAREQAASSQRVLGGGANIAVEYATKRYRSNLINWGMLPLRLESAEQAKLFEVGDYVFIRDIKIAVESGQRHIKAMLLKKDEHLDLALILDELTPSEKDIIKSGSLINYYGEKGR